jgi:rhamnulokinase
MAGAKFLALDYGAGSGRAILATLTDKIVLQELHRFYNPQVKMLDHYYWDLPYLFSELKKGLTAASRQGHSDLAAIGVDTWGVDYGLLGEQNCLLGHPYAYRDSRTEGMMDAAFAKVPAKEIYDYTGIQFMSFNTIYQLYSMLHTGHPLLPLARRLLFMPDILNFLMTGEMACEYTIASTSQLLNARTRTWEPELINRLGLPLNLFGPLVEPGTVIGPLLASVQQEVELPAIDVVATSSHDTASAVAAVPARGGNWAYLSSGTWSLIGIEASSPTIDDRSYAAGFTNEGGVENTIRFLRNVMGMWLFEQCRARWEKNGEKNSYNELIEMANQARPFKCIINPDDARFLNPPDMPQAIASFCQDSKQPAPQSKGEFVRTVLEALALKYRFVLEQIQSMRGMRLDALHIVGGGSQNDLLNQFTANATGLPVIAGPVEATALGNVVVQAMAKKIVGSLGEARELISRSFQVRTFEPMNVQQWNDKYEQGKSLLETTRF